MMDCKFNHNISPAEVGRLLSVRGVAGSIRTPESGSLAFVQPSGAQIKALNCTDVKARDFITELGSRTGTSVR